ncbi:MAG: methylmalonyl Co-A mutase-associated GTPase MeaB [Candidatus Delongbacteria bacterium]|nr:methylmalonyl Co-A mutase-associated GTPase MeaB [Candidatus Delongbacteria bacterium]
MIDYHDLVEGLRQKQPRALARAISLAENDPTAAERVFSRLWSEPSAESLGRVIGITGSPGAGKSTLVKCLLEEGIKENLRMAVLAVDPSSPFSGGAILGDRLRMNLSRWDPDQIYIRSLSARGQLGGLSPGIRLSLNLVKYYRFDLILLETVGVGQEEVDVMYLADWVMVLLVAGLGDDVQAMKAGLMEIADLFVINKATREGSDRLMAELESLLCFSPRFQLPDVWKPPIRATDALSGQGISELWQTLEKLPDMPEFQRHWKKKVERRLRYEVVQTSLDYFRHRILNTCQTINWNDVSAHQVSELAAAVIQSVQPPIMAQRPKE